MPMIVGSVVVSNAGVEVKSGMAEVVYDELKLQLTAQIAPEPLPSGPDGAAALQGLASVANSNAAAVLYIQANAQLRVFASDSGLQKSTSVGVLTAQPDAAQTFGAVL